MCPYASFPFTCASVVSSYAGSELFPWILGQESQKSPSPADCFPLDKSMCPFPVPTVPLFAHKTVPVAHWDISAPRDGCATGRYWAGPCSTWISTNISVLGCDLPCVGIAEGPVFSWGFFLSLECGMIWVSLRSSLACEVPQALWWLNKVVALWAADGPRWG